MGVECEVGEVRMVFLGWGGVWMCSWIGRGGVVGGGLWGIDEGVRLHFIVSLPEGAW